MNMRIAGFIVLAAVAACQPAPAVAPEQKAHAAQSAAAESMPATRATTFPVKSDMGVTGDISLSVIPMADPNAPPSMKLETATGVVMETDLIPGAAALASGIDWGRLFEAEVFFGDNPPPTAVTVDIHKVVTESVPKEATKGGFCGSEPTGFIAMAAGVKSGEEDLIALAAFKSDVWPPESPPLMCGVFKYAMPR